MKPTSEQKYALDLALTGSSCKISAYAGTGKTSTLKLISDNRRDNGLYLAFNKAIATEASSKFSPLVKCKTFHSMAYNGSPKWLIAKLAYNRTVPGTLAQMYGFTQCTLSVKSEKEFLMRYGETYTLSPYALAAIVINTVGIFCRSTDLEIEHHHVFPATPDFISNSDRSTISSHLLQYARMYWENITSQNGNFKIEHDHYLKYWSLLNPIIRADYILFDEAQDADPIMLSILSKQKTQIIYVGDKHQQIYGFRGAINAMSNINVKDAMLTESFRFGNEIAEIANGILSKHLSETKKLVGQSSINSKIEVLSDSNADAFITRTNVKALETFVRVSSLGRNPKLEFDTSKLLADLRDSTLIKNGKNVSANSMFHGFSSWSQVMEYAEAVKNTDVKQFVSLLSKYGADELEHAISKNIPGKTDCIISTAHKSKGMEYEKVILEDDFFYEKQENILTMNPAESRLLYVACTRAKKSLDISKLDEIFK